MGNRSRARHEPGFVVHSAGWPMDSKTYGGGFLYHLDGHRIAIGFVTGLGYANPSVSPYEELQRWKTQSAIHRYFENNKGEITAKRLSYGARAINASGISALP